MAYFPIKQSLVVTFGFVIIYRYIVAAVLGLQVMAIMDLNTFATNPQTPLNVVSMTICSESNLELAVEVFGRLAR